MTDMTVQPKTATLADIPTEHPHIVRTEGFCGGRPRIIGHRISVRTLAEYLKLGNSVEDIVATYPHIDPAAIYDAISYYFDHREEIEAEIEANKLENLLQKHNAYVDDRGAVHFRDHEAE